jgi:hypothetical protein
VAPTQKIGFWSLQKSTLGNHLKKFLFYKKNISSYLKLENIKCLLFLSQLNSSQLQKSIWAITVITLGNHPSKNLFFLNGFILVKTYAHKF